MPRKKSKAKFGEREFVTTVWKEMKGQAKKNPRLNLLHERLAPEFEQVTALIQRFFQAIPPAEEKIIEEIHSFREQAVLPLLDFIRRLKQSGS